MKYNALRIIAKAISTVAWLSLLVNCVILIFISYGQYGEYKDLMRLGYSLEDLPLFSNPYFILAVSTLGLVVSIVLFILILGMSELIKLFINISDKVDNIDNNVFVIASYNEINAE